MKIRLLFLSSFLFFTFGCSAPETKTNSNLTEKKPENVNTSNIEPVTNQNTEANNTNTSDKKTENAGNSNCYDLKRKDLLVDKKQTFAIDFKPFEKSCFVTFHDPEFENPQLGSQFYIYKNGKEVFYFPEQFGEANATCWVDSISFEDLNNDQLKDVIVVGKCGAPSDSYNENMVYLNNGEEFVTNAESNAEMMDFSKVSQIRSFVKKNPKMFIP